VKFKNGIIYNEDFRDIMDKFKNKKIIIVTDPPYNIGYNYDVYNDKISDDDYIELLAELSFITDKIVIIHYPEETIKYIVPALGYPDEIITWCYNSNLPARHSRLINFYGFKPDFKKVIFPYQNPNDKRIKERIKNGSKGRRSYDWFNDIQLEKNVTKEKEGNIHSCPLPLKLMDRIIKYIPDEFNDYIILDVFSGSGTTLKAASDNGYNFIGIEISKNYYKMSVDRLTNIFNIFDKEIGGIK